MNESINVQITQKETEIADIDCKINTNREKLKRLRETVDADIYEMPLDELLKINAASREEIDILSNILRSPSETDVPKPTRRSEGSPASSGDNNPILKKYASMSDSKSPGCKKKFPKIFSKKPWKSAEEKGSRRKSAEERPAEQYFV
ncbi:Oidioi.mRNA.OKI2018_I69.chr2.g6979.t1.cds [Oikopleura dioica]|uniref:Oidioi.mRNA.OKI2018_I69.chr2.g6979.t1.cds n=1 Tax=Oikopleura dioica TaxID=34765 RepID=A0ABN7TAT1_OIKDI|nr:Oidioi.mRNA.OKI2018_I69.chr2.g6979.t1.cds [Oikopleura dioica]